MSFDLRLEVDGVTPEQGRAVEEQVRARASYPVYYSEPWSRRVAIVGRRHEGASLYMPDTLPLLHHEADFDAAAWVLQPSLLPPFAESIRVLGEELPQGFTLHLTWAGAGPEREVELSASALAELAAASQLNEYTRYRVPARR